MFNIIIAVLTLLFKYEAKRQSQGIRQAVSEAKEAVRVEVPFASAPQGYQWQRVNGVFQMAAV